MILGLVMAVVFTITINENMQVADAAVEWKAAANPTIFELQVGESKMLTWPVSNLTDEPIQVEMYGIGEGSELFILPDYITIPPNTRQEVEIFVSVPEDHPNNVEYHPQLKVLKRAPQLDDDVQMGIKINIQYTLLPIIKIGDNPVFTAPEKAPKVIIPEERIINKAPKTTPTVEKEIEETIEEKIARLKAENESNKPIVTKEENTISTSKENTSLPKSGYVPEPMMDSEPIMKDQPTIDAVDLEKEVGGCLIATATFGSELAPQVQLLREIRDNQLMNSGYGLAFMSGFNQLYYSFSPTVADLERQSPAFKELVKLTITPMISTLSIMQYADSDDKVLGLGIGVILMNLGMYVGLPTFGIVKLIQFRKK